MGSSVTTLVDTASRNGEEMSGLALVSSILDPPIAIGLFRHERRKRPNYGLSAQIYSIEDRSHDILALLDGSPSREGQNDDFLFLWFRFLAMLPFNMEPPASLRNHEMPPTGETFTFNQPIDRWDRTEERLEESPVIRRVPNGSFQDVIQVGNFPLIRSKIAHLLFNYECDELLQGLKETLPHAPIARILAASLTQPIKVKTSILDL